jgi:thimet oligopeptidase
VNLRFIFSIFCLFIFGCGSHNQNQVAVDERVPNATTQNITQDSGKDATQNATQDTTKVSEKPIVSVAASNIDLPEFEKSAEELREHVSRTLRDADEKIHSISHVSSDQMTFENIFVALDDCLHDVNSISNRVAVIEQTSPVDSLREEAEVQDVQIQKWKNALYYREDLAGVVDAFCKAHPNMKKDRPDLSVEDLRLVDDVAREFRRAGMNLPKVERDHVQELRNRLAELGVKFDRNIRSVKEEVEFTSDELRGVPNIEKLKRGSKYIVDVRVNVDYLLIAENASLESTRKKIEIAEHTRAQRENTPILQEMMKVRDQIAKALHYKSWADYRLEDRMAKNLSTVTNFLEKLNAKLKSKFSSELAEFKKLKKQDKARLSNNIQIWDWRYFRKQYEKQKFNIDTEALRVFFEISRVQNGIFQTYEDLFGIRIHEIDAPYKWVDDLKLYQIDDRFSKQPLGYLYLDLYPRENKYTHFAEFGLFDGKRLKNGNYQKPVVALVCNFPRPTASEPSLLRHSDVTTFFHEFGHALHAIFATSKYDRFAGTNVPQDFVEAPSQMLESWAYDSTVLDRFAEDYQHSGKKIDPEILKALRAAKLATAGTVYRRQLALAQTDLALHASGEEKDSQKITAKVWKKTFLAIPEGSNFNASWGHLNGYDGSYYGYAWADSIAQDMLTVFEKSPKGLLDSQIGMRLRNEIYSVGWSRPIEESIELFLGRPRSLEAFYQSAGVQ